jgi:trans-aconitate 2-methyltransferase
MLVTDTWDPKQYDKFQRERDQPFFDLLALVHPAPHMRVVDLGCGTGVLTRILHERLQARETIGIDRSARMLEKAVAAAPIAGLRFDVQTVDAFLDGDVGACDLVFSNAVFHWIDGHEALVARLASRLAPHGQMAFQVPANHDHPSHLVADELGAVEPFRSALGGWRRAVTVLEPEAYARLFFRYGFADPIVRLIVYPHVLAGPEDVVEWTKGTLLTEYARRLPGDLFERFVEQYRERLIARLDRERPFFYPFKRILCWGQRSA